MKLTKKQRIIALIVFLPVVPISILFFLMKEICFALSTILENIGHKFGQVDMYIGEKYRQFAGRIK